MKKSLSLGTLLVVILLSTSLFASGVQLTGVGARATALDGAFRGVANDWSAMYWNPAGITQIQGMHTGLSFELIMPEAKYMLKQNVPPFSVYRTEEVGNEPQKFYIPAAGFVYSMENMSFGLSVYAPFGLGAKWDVMNTAAYNDDYPEFDFEDNLQIINIQPTFAYKINDQLSVGLGVSVVLADITIRTPMTTPNPLLFDPNNAAIRDGVLAPMGLAAETYNHILTEKKIEGTGTGFGLNFGLKYNLTEDLSLGLSGCWYNDISLDGTINATTYYAKVDPAVLGQLSSTLDGMIGLGMLTEEQKQSIVGVYSGQQVPLYDNASGKATLPLPMTIGAGISYTGIENLLLSLDVSWTQWSAWDSIEINIDVDNSTSYLVEKWEDGIRVSAGMEYQLTEAMKVRAGYYTEPSAIPDETITITIPDISRRHGINLGFSYNLGAIDLFGSYERLLIGDREVDNWILSKDMSDYDNMAGTYKMSVNNIMFGIGYNF